MSSKRECSDCRENEKTFRNNLHYKCDSVLECGCICRKDSHLSFNQCYYHLKSKLKYELQLLQILNKNIPTQMITIINKYIH